MATDDQGRPYSVTPWANQETDFRVGDPVSKVGGDYRFDGWVVAVFQKRSSLFRYVVEDDRGVLHIYSALNLKKREEAPHA